eukprot:9494106-Pyramimonas_sp.AAC.1
MRSKRAEASRDRMFSRHMQEIVDDDGTPRQKLSPEISEFVQKYQSSKCNTVLSGVKHADDASDYDDQEEGDGEERTMAVARTVG